MTLHLSFQYASLDIANILCREKVLSGNTLVEVLSVDLIPYIFSNIYFVLHISDYFNAKKIKTYLPISSLLKCLCCSGKCVANVVTQQNPVDGSYEQKYTLPLHGGHCIHLDTFERGTHH